MRVLNLGCGRIKMDFPEASGASEVVGVDTNPDAGADVIHDLNVVPYPFASDAFDLVLLQDVVEHLESLPRTMGEVHRVLRRGGRARIRTPHYSSYYAHNDPTHVRCYGAMVFQWFERSIANDPFGAARFRLVKRAIQFPRVWRLLGVSALANRHPERWEQLFAYSFRAENLEFELEAIKD